MNLHALNEIINNHVEILEDTASQTNTDAATIVGIAKFAVSNGYEKLSHNQKYHFDNCIRPLIENIQCSGYNHEFDESPTECYHILDDSDLVEYYREGYKYCESCQARADSDAHSKEVFMRD